MKINFEGNLIHLDLMTEKKLWIFYKLKWKICVHSVYILLYFTVTWSFTEKKKYSKQSQNSPLCSAEPDLFLVNLFRWANTHHVQPSGIQKAELMFLFFLIWQYLDEEEEDDGWFLLWFMSFTCQC